jgi:phosphodiesterase/alkaline phosphatase D-like protein
MNKLRLIVAITAAVAGLLSSNPTVAQILPPQKKAAHVEITQAPALESARDDLTIIRWIITNPGGSDDHFGVVYYGTDPKNLTDVARSHIRLNRNHQETTFRVRITGLKPSTTYYYRVTSIESNGKSDGVQSGVSQFTTPARGVVTNAEFSIPQSK